MIPRQRELARHALGLSARHHRSYRNHFVCGPSHSDFFDWAVMVVEGNATYRPPRAVPFGGDAIFYLTRAGAEDVLKRGEKLDPEDFPQNPGGGA